MPNERVHNANIEKRKKEKKGIKRSIVIEESEARVLREESWINCHPHESWVETCKEAVSRINKHTIK